MLGKSHSRGREGGGRNQWAPMPCLELSLEPPPISGDRFADTGARENVDQEALLSYAGGMADFSTQQQLPSLDFAINHYGQPGVAMFDFTCMSPPGARPWCGAQRAPAAGGSGGAASWRVSGVLGGSI